MFASHQDFQPFELLTNMPNSYSSYVESTVTTWYHWIMASFEAEWVRAPTLQRQRSKYSNFARRRERNVIKKQMLRMNEGELWTRTKRERNGRRGNRETKKSGQRRYWYERNEISPHQRQVNVGQSSVERCRHSTNLCSYVAPRSIPPPRPSSRWSRTLDNWGNLNWIPLNNLHGDGGGWCQLEMEIVNTEEGWKRIVWIISPESFVSPLSSSLLIPATFPASVPSFSRFGDFQFKLGQTHRDRLPLKESKRMIWNHPTDHPSLGRGKGEKIDPNDDDDGVWYSMRLILRLSRSWVEWSGVDWGWPISSFSSFSSLLSSLLSSLFGRRFEFFFFSQPSHARQTDKRDVTG